MVFGVGSFNDLYYWLFVHPNTHANIKYNIVRSCGGHFLVLSTTPMLEKCLIAQSKKEHF